MSKVRNSNIELMRIIAMLFIISHHLLVHGMDIWWNETWSNIVMLSLDSAFFIGVNVFVLISGYCSIRFKWTKLLYLYILTATIGGLCYCAHLFIDNASLDNSIMYNTLFSISHAPGTWFIKVYVYLFCLSPLINKALEVCDKKRLHLILFLLSVICIYFGWFWKDDVNPNGYNLINFIWIYCIGYYLRNYFDVSKYPSIIYLLIWAGLSILNAIGEITSNFYVAWTYNNPLIVIAAISFFLFFISFDFSSKIVNILAKSTLSIYLIHENIYVSQLLYSDEFAVFYSFNVCYFILTVLMIYLSCFIIDVFIQSFIVSPLLKFIHKTESWIIRKCNKKGMTN